MFKGNNNRFYFCLCHKFESSLTGKVKCDLNMKYHIFFLKVSYYYKKKIIIKKSLM